MACALPAGRAPLPPAPPPPVVPTTATFRQEAPGPILVPAKGDAFDFRLHVVYNWTAQNMTYEELRFRAERYLGWAAGIVRERAVGLAREHEPHRSHDLERALNGRLGGQRWPREGAVPHFSVLIRVSPDERVRERLRPYREIGSGSSVITSCRRSGRPADELTRRWCAVLQNLRTTRSPRTRRG